MVGIEVLIFEWIIIFLINLIPAFMPPTWMTLSFFYITSPQNIFLLVFIGVSASTVGRYCLAKGSGKFFARFGTKKKQKQMKLLQKKLHGKPIKVFIFTLLFSLSPLPSNALFIAVGATKTKLKSVVAGFFVGRSISYLFLVFTTEKILSSLGANIKGSGSMITILIEVVGVIAIIIFFLFDWEKLLGGKEKPRGSKK
jgi:membrane protein YqaA with SNARE-associated domain